MPTTTPTLNDDERAEIIAASEALQALEPYKDHANTNPLYKHLLDELRTVCATAHKRIEAEKRTAR